MKKIDTQSRKFKYGSMATLFTVIVVVGTILLNIVASLVVEKFNWRFDMTDTKLYQMSSVTKETVPALDQAITITVFNNKDDALSILKEYITRIAALNDKITVSYIDPYTNPGIVDKYNKEGYNVQVDDVMVEGPQRKKYITRLGFFDVNEQEGTVSGVIAEQVLVSAFLYVTREDLPVAVFSDGHNEMENEPFMKLFDNNSYVVYKAALAVQDIREDAEIFVIPAPTRDFTADEIKKLDAFMAKGKKIIAFIPPASEPMPNLEGFLAEWGIGVRPEVVLEKELYVADNPLNLHAVYAPHAINNFFASNRYYPVVPACRALEVLSVPGGVSASPVLTTSADAYGKAGTNLTTLERQEGDAAGPFSLAIASQKRVTTADGEKDAKIFAAGSAMMIAPDLLATGSFANADFVVQVIGWCSDSDKGVNIPAKKLSPDPMTIMTYQVALFGLIFIVIIPLGILIYGVVVFFRRRHL